MKSSIDSFVRHLAYQVACILAGVRPGRVIYTGTKEVLSGLECDNYDNPCQNTDENSRFSQRVPQQKSALVGILISHGRAPYNHEIGNKISYYVKVRTQRGMRTIWGVALEDAISTSGVSPGDKVEIRQIGSSQVVVDDKGASIVTHRNDWKVDRLLRL